MTTTFLKFRAVAEDTKMEEVSDGFFRREMLHFSHSSSELSPFFRSPRWTTVVGHRGLLHNELQRFVATHNSTSFSPCL